MAEKRVDRENLKRFAENLKTNANILKRETSYNVNETVNKGQVVLKCITAGITDKEVLNLSAVSVGDTVVDGTAEWQVKSTTGYGSGDGGGTSVSEWVTATSYEIGQIVIYGDSLYRCITDHTSNTFNGDIANWELMYSDIAEWRDNVYYTEGVTVIHDHKLYQCIIAHLSISTFDGAKWQIIGDYVAVPVKVGSVGFVSWQYTLMQNHLSLDGGTINNFQATYPELYDFFDDNNLITTVQADYDTNHALLLYDSVNDEATMPDFLDKTVWGGNTVEEKEAGLPNITGSYGLDQDNTIFSAEGAIYNPNKEITTHASHYGATNYGYIMAFDASRSSSIYSDSVTTVQPPSIQLIPQIRYTQDYIEGAGGGTSISEWEIATDYEVGNIVIYANSLYRCIADHTSTTFSADEANWQLMFADIKEWTTNVYYKIGVVAIKDKQLYRCILNHTSSDFAEEVTNWQLIGGLPSWKPNTTYKKDSLVYSDGILYRVTQDFTSTTIFDETYLEPLTGGGGGSGGVKQVTKLGVIAPRDVEIEISPTNKFNMPPVEVLKLSDGTTNITTNALTFDAGDGSKFNVEGKVASESQLVIFDSTARPNHGIKYFFGETTKMVDNYYAESETINLADYTVVEGVTLA